MANPSEDLQQESLYLKINEKDTLHLKRFYCNTQGIPVFMVHGSIENGKIFYSSSGKGLAPYLANQGYDVFIVDLRGRGLSTPPISRESTHGLSEILNEDIPACVAKIKEIKGEVPQHWISHSWGGVHMLSYLAKNHGDVNIASIVFYSAKRRISIITWRRIYLIEGLWNIMAKYSIWKYGYLTAKKIKMGADNESAKSHRQTNQWVYSKKWIDWEDGFDYSAALKKIKLPPILSLTGAGDNVLGHPTDVKLLLTEIGDQDYEYRMLGEKQGNLHNYGHINILTHPDAVNDQFPITVEWMKMKEKANVKC